MERRSQKTRFDAVESGEEKHIEGYFVVFGSRYEIAPGIYETVEPSAFEGVLERDDVRALNDHDSRLVLGRVSAGTLELRLDEKGLWGRIHINPNDTEAMNLYYRVQRGDIDQCSFGFDAEESAEYEGNEIHNRIRHITKLYEVSVVTFPAYEETSVTARSLRRREIEQWKKLMMARLERSCKHGIKNNSASKKD